MTEYRVVLARSGAQNSVDIKAEKVNLGMNKLWFYDAENHLIAVYRWSELVGFEVIGSAAEQVFTDGLLHEKLPATDHERAAGIEDRGLLTVLLEDAADALKKAIVELRGIWSKVNDENKNKTQIQLLVQQREARLRNLQAELIDRNRDLQKILDLLQMEFKDMGLPGNATASNVLPPVTPHSAVPEKKKWFS